MAGLSKDTPAPESLTVHGQSRVLEVGFSDGKTFRIPFELMRVYSPSAEVQGHGPGQETLQTGKREVTIVALRAWGTTPSSLRFRTGTIRACLPGNICIFWVRSRTNCGPTTTNAFRPLVLSAMRPCPKKPVATVPAIIEDTIHELDPFRFQNGG